MSPWLSRLETATDYQELQRAFNEIAAAATTGEDPQLARTIDEVIRRIEAERARDEQELADIQSRYDDFQQQNKGVIGWFKRHIPFTETRKQELAHRDDMADQSAEILGDNFVIARAQMLKERLLPANERRLGRNAEEWRQSWDSDARRNPLPAQAELLKQLSIEIDRSRGFIAEVKRDVEAFAQAKFKQAEEQSLHRPDLAAGRKELEALEAEVAAEATLKAAALKQFAEQTAAELNSQNAAFRQDGEAWRQLKQTVAQADAAKASAAKLAAAAHALGKLAEELHGLPALASKLRSDLSAAEERQRTASVTAARKQTVFDDRRSRYEEARRNVEQKQLLLGSAKQYYDDYQRQQPPAAASESQAEIPDSPVIWRYNEAQEALAAAQGSLAEIEQPHAAAKREADQANAALAEANQQVDKLRRELLDLEQRGPQLRNQLAAAGTTVRNEYDRAAGELASYLAASLNVSTGNSDLTTNSHGWLTAYGLDRSILPALCEADRDFSRHQLAAGVLAKLTKWQESQKGELDRQRSALRSRRDAAFKRRTAELLGDALAKEIGEWEA